MAGLSVSLDGISKSFGAESVLNGVDLAVKEGELVSLLGPSGCGKSTLLRIIAGLERQNAGSVKFGGISVDALPAGDRDLAMVFQSYALYPHMSVAENIGLPLEMTELNLLQRLPLLGRFAPGARRRRRLIDERVQRTARLTEIEHLLRRRPAQLSGGQRQRVALARAIVREPRVFLMDEPLSNLDAKLRVTMREEIVALNRRLGATFLFVTHDQSDAMAMSDRIALMIAGRIRQFATPQEIYDRPAHIDVATFIGQPAIGLFPAEIDRAGHIQFAGARAPFATADLPVGQVQVGVRAEAFEPVGSEPGHALFSLQVRSERVEQMGAEILLRCRLIDSGRTAVCRLSADRFHEVQASSILSDAFFLAARGRGVHIFASDGTAVSYRLPRQNLRVAQ